MDQEWPEFREWYALMLEEEALFGKKGNLIGEAGSDDDNRHRSISERMHTLRDAMERRDATSPCEEAMLAVLALYECEKTASRFLTIGSCNVVGADAEHYDFEHRIGVRLIENTIRRAVTQNILPGIAIHLENANA
jgi:hypothetical protein